MLNSSNAAIVISAAVLMMARPLPAETLRVPRDHKAIQAAVDAARSGDVVLVAAGTYRERIRLRPAITLRSEGDDTKGKIGLQRAEATILDGGGKQGDRPGVSMAEGATLDGFTVTNVGIYDDAKWQKHHATQGNLQSHEHIGEPGTPGIGIVGVNCTVQHNIVHHIGYTGIAIQGISGRLCSPHIVHNVCYRNMGGGIGSLKKSTALIEENTCFENFYAGIGHDDASPLVIHNVCYQNIRAGIGISEGSCPVVRGNKCYQNRRAGIGTRTGSETRPLIEDNDCYENAMAGIGTEESAAPIIRGNRCYRNQLAGIGSRQEAAPLIVGNECFENEKAGIGQQTDAKTILIDNYIHHNKAAGIGFEAAEKGTSRVLRNRVINNALVAVGIHTGWHVELSGNELSREGGLPPIVMVFAGSHAMLTDNTLRGGGVAGIRTAGKVRAEHNRFVGTMLRAGGPPNFAIWALSGSHVEMRDNEVTGWRHALFASEATVSAQHNTVSSFHKAAFVVRNSPLPAVIRGNIAVSKDKSVTVVDVDGADDLVTNNRLVPPSK